MSFTGGQGLPLGQLAFHLFYKEPFSSAEEGLGFNWNRAGIWLTLFTSTCLSWNRPPSNTSRDYSRHIKGSLSYTFAGNGGCSFLISGKATLHFFRYKSGIRLAGQVLYKSLQMFPAGSRLDPQHRIRQHLVYCLHYFWVPLHSESYALLVAAKENSLIINRHQTIHWVSQFLPSLVTRQPVLYLRTKSNHTTSTRWFKLIP